MSSLVCPETTALQAAGRAAAHYCHGVNDGARTRDVSAHNRVLCQLSYAHHVGCPVVSPVGIPALRSIIRDLLRRTVRLRD